MASAVCITESRPCSRSATRQAIRLLMIIWETRHPALQSVNHVELTRIEWRRHRSLTTRTPPAETPAGTDRTESRNGAPEEWHVTDSQNITGHSLHTE
jgi:hypothetical protein